MKITISCDDGDILDLKLIKLLEKYRFPCIFYLPVNSYMARNALDRLNGFEIGGHGVKHVILTEVGLGAAWLEINGCMEWFRMRGKQLKSFCYPRGRYNDEIKKLVEKAGFIWARTTKVLFFKNTYDPYEVNTAIHVYQRKEYKGQDWLKLAKKYLAMKPEQFHIWMHSWEVEKFDNWEKLEELFKHIKKNYYEALYSK